MTPSPPLPTTLGALTLLLPGMLWGMSLLALPIAAHLMRRRARREIVFPSVALLSEAVTTQASMRRLRRWVLLAVRCILIAVIVMAFAQPVWRSWGGAYSSLTPQPQEGATLRVAQGVAVVLLVDRSASMAQRTGAKDESESEGVGPRVGVGVEASGVARAAAERVLNALTPGEDAAGVIYIDANPDAAYPALTRNLAAVRAELADEESLRPRPERGDVVAAVATAGELLRGHGGPRRVVVISDLQASQWSQVAAAGGTLPEGTAVTILDLGLTRRGNVTLEEPEASAGVTGRSAAAGVTVVNHDDEPTSPEVTMSLDGEAMQKRVVQLAPGERQRVIFDAAFLKAGSHTVRFAIDGDDALEADNVAYAVATVRERPVVVVMTEDGGGEGGGGVVSGGYVVARALAPRGDERDRFEVRWVEPDGDVEGAVRGAAAVGVVVVVVGGDLDELSGGVAEAVRDFLKRGGGVAVTGDADVAGVLRSLGEAGVELHAAERGVTRGGAADGFDAGATGSALLREFDPASMQALRSVSIRERWMLSSLAPPGGGDWTVWLRFADATPAIVYRRVGRGSLAVLAFPLSGDGGDLSGRGGTVALLQALMVNLLAGSPGGEAGHVGEPLVMPLPGDDSPVAGPIRVIDPRGKPIAPHRLSRDDAASTLTIDHADHPGFYIARSPDASAPPLALAAAGVDPREGDLRPIPAEAVQAMFAADGVADAAATLGLDADRLDLGDRPLWGWFLLAALILAGVESGISIIRKTR